MTKADFFAALHTIAPGSTPEAAQKWIDFAAECVSEEKYVNFKPSNDPEVSVEKWLDTLCGGFYAVRAEYGAELTGKLVGLSLAPCCLYPGEMLQAAECLRDGGTAETISGKIALSEIESEQPFFPCARPSPDRTGLRPGYSDPGARGSLWYGGSADGTGIYSVEWNGAAGE